MLLATFLFSIMGVCVKLAADYYTTAEIVCVRGLVGLIFMGILTWQQGGSLRTNYPMEHLWRGVIGVVSISMWFYSLASLPLATGMTFNYAAPIWIAAIIFVVGVWQGKTRFEWGMTTAIIASFIGVLLMLRPAFDAEQVVPSLIGMSSGFIAALAYLQVRKLGLLGEPEYRVVFYLSVTSVIGGLLAQALLPESFSAHLPPRNGPIFGHHGIGLLTLLAIGTTATVAQVAMTRAYRLGKTLVTANLQYSGIIFASMWGILIWGDLLDWQSWAGIILILASGISATWLSVRPSRK